MTYAGRLTIRTFTSATLAICSLMIRASFRLICSQLRLMDLEYAN